MQVIFSCENSTYMWWQAELLHHSYVRAGMREQLTALVSATDTPTLSYSCSLMHTANYKDMIPGDSYSPLNKPGAIFEWARLQDNEDTVLIVDPDSIFVSRFKDPGPVPQGEAFADEHSYMDPELPVSRVVLERHCKRTLHHKVQPVGIYILINRSDLVELAPRWLQKAIDIRSDPVCRGTLPDNGWISEMWGYAIAAAELGVFHHISTLSQVTGSDCLLNPIIHYCFPLNIRQYRPETNSYITFPWGKGDYRPWERPPRTMSTTAEGAVFLTYLDALALWKRSSIAG
jgi:hypothetical protein